MKPPSPHVTLAHASASASKLLRRSPTVRLAFILSLVITLFLLLAPHYPAPRPRAPLALLPRRFYAPAPPPRPVPADVCLIVGHDRASDQVWRFNSRSLCVTGPVCISNRPSPVRPHPDIQHSSDFARTTCRLVTPSFNNLPYLPSPVPHFSHHTPSCAAFHRRFAACPLISPTAPLQRSCLADRPTAPADFAAVEKAPDTLVLHGITIVVPRYPYTNNIFHFLNVATLISEVAHHVPTILAHYGTDKLRPPDALRLHPITVLFLLPPLRIPWQSELLSALIRTRVARASPTARVDILFAPTLEQTHPHIYVRNPILLGQRGHVNVWPFANASEAALDASAVPASAIRFREDVYAALRVGAPPLAHTLDAPASGADSASRVALPPRMLGYARRPGLAAVVSRSVHAAGTVRRFGAADEKWIAEMLRNETAAAGFGVKTFTVTPNQTLQEQVRLFAGLGVLVGIHGANLVNAVFMRPMSAIVELFPANVTSPCYIAGMNSGLAYWGHHAVQLASPQESGCSKAERRCWKLTRQRLVKIGTPEDRIAIRKYVRSAIQHVAGLHRAHPDGVPVRFDEADGVFRRVS